MCLTTAGDLGEHGFAGRTQPRELAARRGVLPRHRPTSRDTARQDLVHVAAGVAQRVDARRFLSGEGGQQSDLWRGGGGRAAVQDGCRLRRGLRRHGLGECGDDRPRHGARGGPLYGNTQGCPWGRKERADVDGVKSHGWTVGLQQPAPPGRPAGIRRRSPVVAWRPAAHPCVSIIRSSWASRGASRARVAPPCRRAPAHDIPTHTGWCAEQYPGHAPRPRIYGTADAQRANLEGGAPPSRGTAGARGDGRIQTRAARHTSLAGAGASKTPGPSTISDSAAARAANIRVLGCAAAPGVAARRARSANTAISPGSRYRPSLACWRMLVAYPCSGWNSSVATPEHRAAAAWPTCGLWPRRRWPGAPRAAPALRRKRAVPRWRSRHPPRFGVLGQLIDIA